MSVRKNSRFAAAFAVATLAFTIGVLSLTGAPSGAADCDIARFTVDGQPDIASYLQCQAPAVTPATVSPGGEVTVSAGGYAANCDVVIALDSTELTTTRANGFGNIATSVRIPSNTSLGAHEIRATCLDPAGNTLVNVLGIDVVASGSTGSSGGLPRTGDSVGGYVGAGLALIALGGAVVYGARRNGRTTADA